jgi:outer membrane receptor for ferrienterochelin and colicins
MTRSPPARRWPQRFLLLAAAAGLASAAGAQNAPTPAPQEPSAPGSAPSPSPSSPSSSTPADPTRAPSQQVEIRSDRTRETDERRQSTAAKIVIGRDDIERMGDSTTSEVLKRLPGVTIGGAPGRGGGPRMRGMGAGFTQIMMNGERLPPGFSVDSITPEQIERIELLRAPTAETGARAIAGTINIILREGLRKRLNDLKVGVEVREGRTSPSVFWTRNDSLSEEFIYTAALGVFGRRSPTRLHTQVQAVDLATGAAVSDYTDDSFSLSNSTGVNGNARLQFRFGEGHSLVLMPMLIASDTRSSATSERDTAVGVPEYATSQSSTEGRFTLQRLNTQYNRMLGNGTRLDLRANTGVHRWRGDSLTTQRDAAGATVRTIDNRTDWRDRNTNLGAKASTTIGRDHNLVGGVEIEDGKRSETRVTLDNGAPPVALDDFGENVEASTRRTAVYLQDEWNQTPQWAFHAGLRWEGIETHGQGANGVGIRNRSNVATPLLHAVYKLDAQRRDQVRMSLTQSYRTPTLAQLIARPLVASNNSLTSPDRYGNPDLKPELANGVDVAFERYLDEGGVLSANLFHRRIRDVIRTVTTVDATTGRAQSRPVNLDGAITTGLELEAKFRLDQAIDDAPRVDLRLNGSVFHSKVDGVPGPDNRIDGQPNGTVNFGADYRLRGTPLSFGGNLNWTPAVRTRLTEVQVAGESSKLIGDAYALWTFDPSTQLRLSANNLAPRDYRTTSEVEGGGLAQTRSQLDRGATTWQVRLEVKL